MTGDWESTVSSGRDGADNETAQPPAELLTEFAQLGRMLHEADTVGKVLQRVIDAAVAVVPGTDLASVTLVRPDGSYSTPTADAGNHGLATQLDELQYTHGEGPCLQATRTPGPGVVCSDDLTTEPTWPGFGPAAAKLGVRSVLATGMFPDADPPRLGALNLYSYHQAGFAAAAHGPALLLAAHAAAALATTEALTAAELETAQLREALHTRDVIGQAKGILMRERGYTAEQAFGELITLSQHLNIKLVELARTLTQRHNDL